MASLVVVTCIALLAILLVSGKWRRESSRIRCYEYEGTIVRMGIIPESDPCLQARGKEGLLVRWDGDSEDSWIVAWTLGNTSGDNLWIGDPEVRARVRACYEKYVNALGEFEVPAEYRPSGDEEGPR